MMEPTERKPYWRNTKWQMLASVVPVLTAMILVPLYAATLNFTKFLNFPLGYFFAGHGLALLSIASVAWFVNRQDAIDRWHGAHEEA